MAKHFILENDFYVYEESEFTVEDSFQKSKLLDFINRLSYIAGVVSSDEVGNKRKKCLIDVSLLMGTFFREGI